MLASLMEALDADLAEANLQRADLRGAVLGPLDLDGLRALKGASITSAQAGRLLEELVGVLVSTD